LAQAGVLKHYFETQKADFDVAQSTQRDLRLSYSSLIQQLIERSNVREAEQKAQMAAVESENRRLKVLIDGVSHLEFIFLESRALVHQMQEVCQLITLLFLLSIFMILFRSCSYQWKVLK
jgi:hypothetical protein